MRVVSGEARGRRLVAPAGDTVRPTTDRVREATFNALGSLDAIRETTVLDLFAGSGALGIEALSRGAKHCTFVDSSRVALESVRANLDSTGLGDRARVMQADALEVVVHAAALGRNRPHELVLADPPYDFEQWDTLLEALDAEMVVIESRHPVTPPPPWSVLRQRTYGTTVVTIAERADPEFRSRAQDPQQGKDHP